jgi:hypothetical protein
MAVSRSTTTTRSSSGGDDLGLTDLNASRGKRPYSRERSQQLQRSRADVREEQRERARLQLRPSSVEEGFEQAREAPALQLPLAEARRLLQKPGTAATTRLYSASGVSSQYWLNPTSRHNLVDVLGEELSEKLRNLERAALVTMQRRTECDAALSTAQAKLAETCALMAAEAAAAEKDEVRAVFKSIDLDDNGTLERDELAMAAERLGQSMSEQELDAAMSEMDEDGSGEIDFDEFLSWWDRRKASGKGGLFGGLFDDPLEMSDDYLRMQIVIDKRKREAAHASAEAGGAAESLEALSLEAGLRLRAFAEFERQHQLLDEQGAEKKPPAFGATSEDAAVGARGLMRIGSAGSVRKSAAVARGALMLGRPKSAAAPLLRDTPPATAPNPNKGGQQQQRRGPPSLPPALRLAAAANATDGGGGGHSRAATGYTRQQQRRSSGGSRRVARASSAGYARSSPFAPPRSPVPASSFTSFFSSPAATDAAGEGVSRSPKLEPAGATMLGSGPVLQKRLNLRPRQDGGRDSSFSGLYNSSPWEQRRREGESTRKMRGKFAEFHSWYSRNASSLIAKWVAEADAAAAATAGSPATEQAAASPASAAATRSVPSSHAKRGGEQPWLEAGEMHREREAGKAWGFYGEISEQFGPALTTK